MKTNRILITGGFGAIGINLINKLLENNLNEIHVIDNLSAGTANFSSKVQFSHLDISNSEKVNSFFNKYKPNFIFHLAAHFANQNSVDHPISDVETNVIGVINILESQKTNEFLQKFVYASSSCVYGNCSEMSETTEISPYDTPYAINKYVGELYGKYYAEIHKIPLICARIFNSFGPGEMPGQYRNVIPNFVNKALLNEDIIITGSGNETRDFTFVNDTVDLLIKLSESSFNKAEIFNAGTGTKTSINYLANKIVELTNSKSQIIYKEARGWDHVKNRCSDISKSSQHLNYNPNSDFESSLIDTINWIREKLILNNKI
jgi:nucleoside-diphosphate-sugar epimerase